MTLQTDDAVNHLAKHDQMVSCLAQIGRVVEHKEDDPPEPEPGPPRVLVHIGGEDKGTFTRTWMPWLAARAGSDAEWWKPDLEEQVLVLSPSGNPSHGIVIGSIYRGNRLNYHDPEADLKSAPKGPHQPPDGKNAGPVEKLPSTGHLLVYRDGTSLSYDREAHKLDFQIKTEPSQEEAQLALLAQLAKAEGDGETTVSVRLGKSKAPDATICLSAAKDKNEIEIQALQKITLKVGDGASCVIAKEEIQLKVGDTPILKVNADGVVANK